MKKQRLLVMAVFMAVAAVSFFVSAESKTWKWKPATINGGATWGNMGYLAGEQNGSTTITGAWWGCGPIGGSCGDTFESQMAFQSDRTAPLGDEYVDSKMEFTADGKIIKYDPNGNVIGNGTWQITEWYDGNVNETFSMGTLKTSEGAIMWPFAINKSGYMPTKFEIGYLSTSTLILVYAAPGTGAWSEATWWSFGSDDGVDITTLGTPSTAIDGVMYYYNELEEGVYARAQLNPSKVKDIVIKDKVEIDGVEYPVIGIGPFANNEGIETVTMPSSIKQISTKAFQFCTNLREVTFSDAITTIGICAFEGTALTNVTMPADLETFPEHIFSGCENLQSVVVPNNFSLTSTYAFEGCPSLTSFKVREDCTKYMSDGKNIYTKDGSELVLIAPANESFDIAESCTTIGQYAGAYSNVKHLVIPNSVRNIGYAAFENSTMEQVSLPENQPENVGLFPFMFCNNITTVTIPDAWTYIPDHFFTDCHGLNRVNYGENITKIGNNAFSGCYGLMSFEFKPTLRIIDSGFSYCGLAGDIVWPEGIKTLGADQNMCAMFFSNTPNITSVTIPSTVVSTAPIALYPSSYDISQVKLQKVVNLSATPIALDNWSYKPNPYNENAYAEDNIYYFPYYCMPGVGVCQFSWLSSEWALQTRTMEGCREIVDISNVTFTDDTCTFTIETANEEFEITCVYYDGVPLAPQNVSRASQVYRVEGITEADLCKITLDIKYHDNETTNELTIDSTGEVNTVSTHDIALRSENGMAVYGSEGMIQAVGARKGAKVDVYDLAGNLLSRMTVGTNGNTVLADGLTPGVYIVKADKTTAKVMVR